MKFRIKQDGTGRYFIEYKKHFLDHWRYIYSSKNMDYVNSEMESYIKQFKENYKQEKLSKQFKVLLTKKIKL